MAKKEMSAWEKEVRKALIDRNMSVPDLADVIGCNVTYVYDIFSGARPGVKYVDKINDFLGLDGE